MNATRTGVAVVMAALVALMAAGLTTQTSHHQPAPHPTPTPTPTPSVTPAVWIHPDWTERLTDARVELEATTTAIHAAHLDGQPLTTHETHCRAAVADFNTAAAHLNTAPINPSKECTP